MESSVTTYRPGIQGHVRHSKSRGPIRNAEVRLVRIAPDAADHRQQQETEIETAITDHEGRFRFRHHPDGEYVVRCVAFGKSHDHRKISVSGDYSPEVAIDFPADLQLTLLSQAAEEGSALPVLRGVVGRRILLRAEYGRELQFETIRWRQPQGARLVELGEGEAELIFSRSGMAQVEATAVDKNPNAAGGRAEMVVSLEFGVSEPEVQVIAGQIGVTLQRTKSEPTLDQALWVAIRNRTHAIGFNNYRRFLDSILAWDERDRLPQPLERRLRELGANMHGVGAYQVLKLATETFLLLECGVRISPENRFNPGFDARDSATRLGEPFTREQMQMKLAEYLGHPAQLPYITRVVDTAFPDFEREDFGRGRLLTSRINEPCLIELIWNYWHEEGMLMQTLNAISLRFQNVRTPNGRNPLGNVEIDPLRPLNNLLWGVVQDEPNRLSVKRRAYEYAHQYGLVLFGRAAPGLRPADNRSKFLEAFHNLLHQASVFYEKDFQTTVIADGFPLLNSLQEVHLVLAQGAHNQFGDLAWTARTEMLLAQYMLARPEIRDFLQSRAMVPYKEAWMPQVDTMKTLQGWSDVSVTYFRDLAVYGEQLLLSVRYADWIHVNDEDSAKNWARYWRPEIQGYLHAYRAATGIDLVATDTVDSTLPAVHLQRRLASQQARMR